MRRSEIVLSRLDAIIERLSCLLQDDIDIGWSTQLAAEWSLILRTLRQMISEATPLPPRYRGAHFVRWLDADGIGCGELYDLAVELGPDLRALAVVDGDR